jgi:hypothetical protein
MYEGDRDTIFTPEIISCIKHGSSCMWVETKSYMPISAISNLTKIIYRNIFLPKN